jgi:hypothetical protein
VSKIPGEELAVRIETGVAKILPGLVEGELNKIGPQGLLARGRITENMRERATFLVMCSLIEDLQERVKSIEDIGK